MGLWPLTVAAAALLLIAGWLLFRLVAGGFSGGSGLSAAAAVQYDTGEETEADTIEKPAEISQWPMQTIVYFQPESANLSEAAMAEIKALAGMLSEGISIEVGGHCANYGTERGRRALSRLRADVVTAYLSELIPTSVNIEAKGYGGSRPLSDDPELQDVNRRVEINVMGSAE